MGPLFRFIVVTALSLSASAPSPVSPADSCIAIDHFPQQPVGNAPSKAILYITLPVEWGGGVVVVSLSGASGQQTGEGVVDDQGLAVAELPLTAYGEHQIDQVTLDNGSTTAVDVDGLVDGGAFAVNDSEPQCDPNSLVAAPTTSTTTTTTTTTSAPVATTSAPSTTITTTAPAATPQAQEFDMLPWLLVAAGGILAVLGLWLLRKKSCDDLYILWQEAQSRYETCAEELLKAQRWLEEKRGELSRLQTELQQLEKSVTTGSITQGDTTFVNLPGRGLVTAEGMGDIINSVNAQIESAQQAVQMGEEMVENWRLKTEDSAAQAEAARRAYEDCVGSFSATNVATTSGAAPAPSTGNVAATTSAAHGCPPGDRRAVPEGEARTFRVYRAFRIETETDGEPLAGEAGTQLAADLNQLGAELGFLGALLGAHGAGSRIAEGIVTASATSVIRGTAEGYAAAKGNLGTSTFSVPIPTSPQEVLVGVLQLIAQMAGIVAGKASEWTQRRTWRSYRLVKEYQTITVQPFRVEECDGTQYRCIERIRQYTVGAAGTERGQLKDGGMGINAQERAAQERQLRILINQGSQAMERSVKALMDYEAQHPIGPCQ